MKATTAQVKALKLHIAPFRDFGFKVGLLGVRRLGNGQLKTAEAVWNVEKCHVEPPQSYVESLFGTVQIVNDEIYLVYRDVADRTRFLRKEQKNYTFEA